MTEVPEHLLKKAAEARARLTGQAPADSGDAGSGGDAPAAETAPVPAAAAAPAPVITEEPKAPEPLAPYVEAAETRKRVPVWIIPVLVFLPFWAIFYVGYLENPPVEAGGLLFEGEEVYTQQCAGCHGGGGGGGSGRQLNGGEVLLTFPSLESGAAYDGIAGNLHWVANGTAGSEAEGLLSYGDPDRAGGARVPGSFGQMSGFASLSPEQLIGAVYYIRHSFGGENLTAEGDEAELHLLEEVLHVMEEAGVTTFEDATLPEIQGWVDEARLKVAEAEGE
ncbi:MAG: c-type cytochrome [Actinomycetota bacterium]